MTNPFSPATKEQTMIRLLISGPSKAGKTWTAMMIAEQLSKMVGKPFAFLDTEGRSARKYSDHFKFDVLDIANNYSHDVFIDAIKAAVKYGYGVIVIDSLTHAWSGTGGILELVNKTGQRMGGNEWAGWSKGRPAYNSMIDAIISSPIHIIAVTRAKTEWVLEEQKDGKTKPVRKGLKPAHSPDIEYEFDLVGMMEMDHTMLVSGSRVPSLPENEYIDDYPAFVKSLYNWATDGVIAKPTAGATYLYQQEGKDKLRQFYDDYAISKSDYPKLLKDLEPGKSLQSFAESTLSEDEFYARLAELIKQYREAADAPVTEPADPIQHLLLRISKELDNTLSHMEILKLAGVDKFSDVPGKYASTGEAFDAIKQAFNASVSKKPKSSQPDMLYVWKSEDADTITEYIDAIGLSREDALSILDTKSFLTCKLPIDDAMNKLRQEVINRQSELSFRQINRVSKSHLEAIIAPGDHEIRVRFYSRNAIRRIDESHPGELVNWTEFADSMDIGEYYTTPVDLKILAGKWQEKESKNGGTYIIADDDSLEPVSLELSDVPF